MPKNYHKVESSFQVYFFVCVSLMCLINFGLGLLRTLIRISLSLSLWYFQPQICFVMLSSPGIYCPHIFFFLIFFLHRFFLSILWSTCASFMFMFIICLGVFSILPCFLANSHLLALPLLPPSCCCRVQRARIPFKY